MSKYGDKKGTARCVVCAERAAKLAMVAGRPQWVCADHYQKEGKPGAKRGL